MLSKLAEKITQKKAVIGLIGMGYIGLSLLDAFGKSGFQIVGFDINEHKVDLLKKKESYLNFLNLEGLFNLLDKKRFKVSSNRSILKGVDVLIISVPTSLDQYGTPNLNNLRSAFASVAANQKKDQLIILQSSTYPGTTQEELLPILENSGLKVGKDFYLAHVPEIADIGNPKFSFTDVPRLISGITPICVGLAELLYKQLGCNTVRCPSTSVAEAAKLLQNAFRLVNISFINEMKILFDNMGLDVWEVISAASSKPFGFLPFYPSPGIGGDCIPIAPVYLIWKAKATEGPATILEDARRINAMMPAYVIKKLAEGLNMNKKTVYGAKILILGVGYKKEVNDVRESAALKIIPSLKEMMAEVSYNDPFVKEIDSFPGHPDLKMKSVALNYAKLRLYDGIVIVTDHDCYDWDLIAANSKLVIDTRHVMANVKGTKKNIINA